MFTFQKHTPPGNDHISPFFERHFESINISGGFPGGWNVFPPTEELLDFEQAAEVHMSLNLENPTAHYSLRMVWYSVFGRFFFNGLLKRKRWNPEPNTMII